jgi:hypothetical protein
VLRDRAFDPNQALRSLGLFLPDCKLSGRRNLAKSKVWRDGMDRLLKFSLKVLDPNKISRTFPCMQDYGNQLLSLSDLTNVSR